MDPPSSPAVASRMSLHWRAAAGWAEGFPNTSPGGFCRSIIFLRPNTAPNFSETTFHNNYSGEPPTIPCHATSPENLPLTYNFSASGGQVPGNGPQAQFDSTGVQPGTVTIKCEVTDSRGDKGEGTTTVEVQQPPPPPQATKVG